MTWIMFLWITGGRIVAPTIASQEFANRAACVKAAIALQGEFGIDFHFMCLEKGKGKGK